MDLDKVRPIMKEIRESEDKIFDNFAPQFNREQIKALEAINDLDKAAEDPMSALADRYNEI